MIIIDLVDAWFWLSMAIRNVYELSTIQQYMTVSGQLTSLNHNS